MALEPSSSFPRAVSVLRVGEVRLVKTELYCSVMFSVEGSEHIPRTLLLYGWMCPCITC